MLNLKRMSAFTILMLLSSIIYAAESTSTDQPSTVQDTPKSPVAQTQTPAIDGKKNTVSAN